MAVAFVRRLAIASALTGILGCGGSALHTSSDAKSTLDTRWTSLDAADTQGPGLDAGPADAGPSTAEDARNGDPGDAWPSDGQADVPVGASEDALADDAADVPESIADAAPDGDAEDPADAELATTDGPADVPQAASDGPRVRPDVAVREARPAPRDAGARPDGCLSHLLLPDPPVRLDTVYRPVAAADLDRNGTLDLLASADTGTKVFLGAGDGSFEDLVGYADLSSSIAGDFDGDGIPDLMRGGSTIRLAVGRGDGRFGVATTRHVALSDEIVVLDDIDGDGKIDGVAYHNREHTLSPLMNGGDNSFARGTSYTIPVLDGMTGPDDVVVADVDGDGRRDLVVLKNRTGTAGRASSAKGQVAWLRNRGDDFSAPVEIDVPSTPTDVRVADLDGDGLPDLVLYTATELMVLSGRGGGSFAPVATRALECEPRSWDIADLDGDGRLDLLFGCAGALRVLYSEVAGMASQLVYTAEAAVAVSALVSDVDGDGLKDVVVGGRRLAVLVNRGGRQFVIKPFYPVGNTRVRVLDAGTTIPDVGPPRLMVGPEPHLVSTDDLDRDGVADLLVAYYRSDSISIFLGQGDGTFLDAIAYPVDKDSTAELFATGDVDGDGIVDLLAGSQSGIKLHPGRGDGDFLEPRLAWGGTWPYPVLVRDLNADGRTDLVVVQTVQPDSRRQMTILMNDGQGGFAAGASHHETGDSVAAADFDGDGSIDLVTQSPSAKKILLWRGVGQRGLGDLVELELEWLLRGLRAVDVDRDGLPDLVGMVSSDGVAVLFNLGHGAFEAQAPYLAGRSIARFAISDLDGDGALDIAVVDQPSPIVVYVDTFTIDILYGRGRGFAPAVVYEIGSGYPSRIAISDVDRDGLGDLLVSHYTDKPRPLLTGGGWAEPGWITVQRNRGWACEVP